MSNASRFVAALMNSIEAASQAHSARVHYLDAVRREDKAAEDAALRKTGADFVSAEFREEVIEELLGEGWTREAALNKTRTQALLIAEAHRLNLA